jgi:Protein of unknown function (DUF1592)/Protein of unknown function (DUF1588)/Protein of unknown function (DUF1587)/Protein of unknown function (DUF1585)/Protein of unknown function (DUF1595)/Planctomycete cytochrome C
MNLYYTKPLALILALTLPSLAEDANQMAFFEKHCTDCHDDETTKGNFNLTALQMDFTNPDNLIKWKNVYDRIESGEMPPKKKSRPPEEERLAALATLGHQLTDAESKSLVATGGRTMVRRMNREEYQNSMRDLLDLPLLHVAEMLPEDGQKYGFDKVAGALDISHIQMTKYLQTADVALRQAMVPTIEKPENKKWRQLASAQDSSRQAISSNMAVPLKGHKLAPGFATHYVGNPKDDIGNTYRTATFEGEADSVAALCNIFGAHMPQGIQIDKFNAPIGGWYTVKFSIWSLRWNLTTAEPSKRGMVQTYTVSGPPYFQDKDGVWQDTPLKTPIVQTNATPPWMENVEFYGEKEATHIVRASLNGIPIGYYDALSMKPTEHELKIWLNPGDHPSFHVMTALGGGATNWPSQNGVKSYEGPGVAFDWFEVNGPFNEQWPPASQQCLFGDKPISEVLPVAEQMKLLETFAARAFRRSLEVDEIKTYSNLVDCEIKRGSPYAEAMLTGYKAILCSPDFLFIGLESGIPQAAKDTLATAGDYALASRISYFLWNSMPDATLLNLAANGTLTQPAVLKKQVERMLVDKRSNNFIKHFTNEWLELKKIDATTPDINLYPEYDTWLHDSMLEETLATFRRMIMQNRSVKEIVAADSIMINQRLAELYGIRDVLGAEIREVKLPKDNPRGGIMTQASILKVTANGTATSPVLRGVWVMERVLGIPRQPVPANVPAIEPDATGAVTIRQMIEKHRADAACATCHSKMDPGGMALEKFDVIGGFRDRYRLAPGGKEGDTIIIVQSSSSGRNRVPMRLGSEVDASGVLDNGQTFADLNSYRKLLLDQEDVLARNVVRQLMIYSTGAGIRFSDRPAIDAIIAKAEASKYGMRSMIQEVVASSLFQAK